MIEQAVIDVIGFGVVWGPVAFFGLAVLRWLLVPRRPRFHVDEVSLIAFDQSRQLYPGDKRKAEQTAYVQGAIDFAATVEKH